MRCFTILFALCTLPIAASAQFVPVNAVDSAALDAVRGGFGYGDSLLVTLGIDRLVQVNGNVVEHSAVQFGDVGKLASGQAQLAGDAPGTRLIQNGQPAQLAAGLPVGALGGTIIQNSLNDQMINNQTTIRASVNSAGVLQTMNFNASLNQALNNAISPR
ncbi:hypothetical protein [Massilia sp. S19_KUP03_FR1]|uniref:hypothetical protein n=1 Tax=Massilia sp. S19_KUP03_FR1 TaxID=3025503 RepID=UPI002FCDCB76